MAKYKQLRISGFILLLVVLGFGISKSRTLRVGATEATSEMSAPAYAIRSIEQLEKLPLHKNEKEEVLLLFQSKNQREIILQNGIEVVIID